MAQHTSAKCALLTSTEALSWSIAGNINGKNPNIFSELKWTAIMGSGIGLSMDQSVYKRLKLSVDLNLSAYLSGHVTDTDYQEDNRQNQTFNAHEKANRGGVGLIRSNLELLVIDGKKLDFSIGTGFFWTHKRFTLINEENGLNSTYDAIWFGPNARTTVIARFGGFFFRCQTDYSQVDYLATANWNLIDEFEHPVSFRHEAKGFQLFSEVSGGFELTSELDLVMGFRHSYFSTGRGIDTLYKTNGTRPRTRLNDVTNELFGLSMGVEYAF